MKKILSIVLTLVMVLTGADCKIFANESQKEDKKQAEKSTSFSWWKRVGTAALVGAAAYKFNAPKHDRDWLNPEPTTPPTSSDEENDDFPGDYGFKNDDDYYGAPLPFFSSQNSGKMGKMIVVPVRAPRPQRERKVHFLLPGSEELLIAIGENKIADADVLEEYKLKHKNAGQAAPVVEEEIVEEECAAEENEDVENAQEEEHFIVPEGYVPDLPLRDYLSAFASERQNAADFLREISRLYGVTTFPVVVANSIAAVDLGFGFSLRLRLVNSNQPTNLLTIPGQLTPFELIVNGEKMLVRHKEINTWHSISETLELIARREY